MENHMKVLEQRERVLGPNADGTALSYYNIGLLYYKFEDYGNSLIYIQKAHDAYQAVFGPTHPYVINSLTCMAGIYYEQEELGKALEYYKQALAACEQFYGVDHSTTQQYRDFIATIEEKIKQQ